MNFNNQHLDFQAGNLACDFIDSPEVRFCETDTSYRPDIKLNGSYLLPYDVQVSATYRGVGRSAGAGHLGRRRTRSITPGLGRPLTSGASKTIALMEPGTEFFPMRHVFDMRFSKVFSANRYRFQVMTDFFNIFNTNAVVGDQHDVRRQPAQAVV